MKIICLICMLFIITGCNLLYAEDVGKAALQERDILLSCFPENKQCILLAFEHQLDMLAVYINAEGEGTVPLTTDITFFDLVSLFYDYTNTADQVTPEGFFDYIVKPIENKFANYDENIEFCKKKILKDYRFILYTKSKRVIYEEKDF